MADEDIGHGSATSQQGAIRTATAGNALDYLRRKYLSTEYSMI